MAQLLTFKRLKEKVAEQMATQRTAGGSGHVIVKGNGMVLNGETGVFNLDTTWTYSLPWRHPREQTQVISEAISASASRGHGLR